jgi:carbon-monoxide dehydrogenase medium subunit
MYAFDYVRPETLESAGRALKTPGAKLLAGGQTLIPAMKLRLNHPALLIDLGRIPGLDKIERRGNALAIGATATHADVATSAVVQSSISGLARLAEGIGDPHVRNLGTIGGSVANNDPAVDYPAGLLALGASLKTNKRTIAADEYFDGLFATFDEDEILTEIVFPIPKRFAYAKFPNPASRFALAGVAVADTDAGIRVAVTGAGAAGVFRMPAMEAALSKDFAQGALKDIPVSASGLLSDIHADAEYRAQLIGVLARRAVQMAEH